jgi:hypothetical protein
MLLKSPYVTTALLFLMAASRFASMSYKPTEQSISLKRLPWELTLVALLEKLNTSRQHCRETGSISPIVRRLGEQSSPACRAKTMREFGVRMGFDIGFKLIPIAIVVTNFLARGADREETP